MIEYLDGDALAVDAEVIMHQTNCKGAMGAGIALQIRKKYPEVYKEYVDFCKSVTNSKELLGKCQIIKTINVNFVANLFGEDAFYPKGVRHTDYDALEKSLKSLKEWMIENEIKIASCPFLLGCGLAGGQKEVVLNILKQLFENDENIILYIVKYVK